MAINERGIVEALGTLPLVGNEEGLIPAFGLYLTRHYADYYNRISYALLRSVERAKAAATRTQRPSPPHAPRSSRPGTSARSTPSAAS